MILIFFLVFFKKIIIFFNEGTDRVNLAAFNNTFESLTLEHIFLELRLSLNKDLYEEKLITYDVFSKMQNLLIARMNKITPNKE